MWFTFFSKFGLCCKLGCFFLNLIGCCGMSFFFYLNIFFSLNVIKFVSDFRYVGGFRYFAGLLIDGIWKENIETCISHDISLSNVITCGVCPTPGTQSLFYFSLTLTVLTWLWSFVGFYSTPVEGSFWAERRCFMPFLL